MIICSGVNGSLFLVVVIKMPISHRHLSLKTVLGLTTARSFFSKVRATASAHILCGIQPSGLAFCLPVAAA